MVRDKMVEPSFNHSQETSDGEHQSNALNVSKTHRSTTNQLAIEARVLLLAKKLMNSRYTLNTHALYRICVRCLKDVDKKDIEVAINSLIKQKTFFEGKALTVFDILKNEKRNNIWKLIKDWPGITFPKIKQKIANSNRLIEWHLHILERFDFIRATQIGAITYFFDKNSRKELDDLYIILNQKKILKIWETVYKNRLISVKKLGKILGIPKSTLYRKIGEMVDHYLLIMLTSEDHTMLLDISPYKIDEILDFSRKRDMIEKWT